MGFDTTYRPSSFEEVVGQGPTLDILRTLLRSGEVFHRSYVFAGPSGTGKTTVARILARAMLCSDRTEAGDPCGQCETCEALLSGSSIPSFREMDAANNSGADNIRSIVSSLDYYVMGGGERIIYLIDEAHRLSNQAMDALLKPMEDTVPGSSDKRLVCLFCTTELHKLRGTIKGRSMVFSVKPPTHDQAVSRLQYICEAEGLEYEDKALSLIFEFGKGHLRDMVTALERVSYTGAVTLEATRAQLGLDVLQYQCGILKGLKDDPNRIVKATREAQQMVDVGQLYKGVAEVAMAAYRMGRGIDTGFLALDKSELERLADLYEDDELLHVARHVLEHPATSVIDVDCELLFLYNAIRMGTLGVSGGKTVIVHSDASEGQSAPSSASSEDTPMSEVEKQNMRHAQAAMKYGLKAARGRVRKDPYLETKEVPRTAPKAPNSRKRRRDIEDEP